MPAYTRLRGLSAPKRSSIHRRRPLLGEVLEARWTPAWSGVPPAFISPPANSVGVTLNAQNDLTGTASIASTEVDYYSLTTPASGSYRLSVTTPSSNLDPVLGLFSSTGGRLAYNDDISNSNRDSQLTVNLTAGSRYYLGITNYTGSVGGSYTLTIDGPAPIATPTDDSYENNDTLATARNFGTLTTAGSISGLMMADASDYYRFTTTAAGTNTNYASISFQHAQGDLDFELYNASGALVARSEGTTNSEQISLNSLAAGTYFVRAYGYQGALNPSYSLNINPPTAATNPTIDLAGAGLSVTNTTSWGQTITVNATVRNSGNATSGGFTEQWYLSRDAVGSSDDILLSRTGGAGTSYNLSGVTAGSSSTLTTTLQLPSALPSGWTGSSFYLVMRTDAAGQVNETNESNNFGQAGSGLDYAPITIGGTTQPGGFQITLNMTGLTTSQQAIFEQAADRWEQVITGDLPNASYNGQTVDDLLVHASASSIDGVGGVLGQAGPDRFRSGSRLPYHGEMEFDSADLANMQSNGSLLDVVMHEIGHILGIGTLWAERGLVTGAGTSNPRFTGSQAVAAYNQIFGRNETGVPVENTGGSGTRDSHWRDSLLGNEMMTGFAGPGVDLPLSRITVASLADLGYVVNLNAADAYTPPSSSRLAGTTSVGGSSSSIVQLASESPESEGTHICASGGELRHRTPIHAGTVDSLMAAFAAARDQDLRRLRA
jgi:hypothetical protein